MVLGVRRVVWRAVWRGGERGGVGWRGMRRGVGLVVGGFAMVVSKEGEGGGGG